MRAAERRGFDLAVLPVLISGVVAQGAQGSLLVRAARREQGRTRAAALYTFLLRASRGQRVRLRAGRLLRSAALLSGDRRGITGVLRSELLAAGGAP